MSRFCSEFRDDAAGLWNVGLNKTSLGHLGLLQAYARSYHRAGRAAFEAFRRTLQDEEWPSNYTEMDAHPIVFLYRHALELYVKTVVVFGEPLLLWRGKSSRSIGEICRTT